MGSKLLIFTLLVTALGATSLVLLVPWYPTVVETRDVITYSYAVPVPPREQTGYVFILQRSSGAMGDVLNPKTQRELGTVFLEAGWKISVTVEAVCRDCVFQITLIQNNTITDTVAVFWIWGSGQESSWRLRQANMLSSEPTTLTSASA